MKTVCSALLFLVLFQANAQDSLATKKIDSLVTSINNSTLPVIRDSVINEVPAIGFSSRAYISMVLLENKVLKYTQHTFLTSLENGATNKLETNSTFYYQEQYLIKVEEYAKEGDKKQEAHWYYHEGKPIYWTSSAENAASRAEQLIKISDAMVNAIQSRINK
ncbi:MAG: hypothetical protein P0Y53_09720 [Candidatus Pseudobacter hemicellulosilyticus]|uniref:DUF4468 domain-containing protein n=1 Tax=Candidatus Pseudobacter hemicellulosilyticus TaxID=3121375 RepID=A0AAJ5WUR9_9BACT|nr:MAG: hypothetical protein P0Y53_09720 [Pseudobacter sp.]